MSDFATTRQLRALIARKNPSRSNAAEQGFRVSMDLGGLEPTISRMRSRAPYARAWPARQLRLGTEQVRQLGHGGYTRATASALKRLNSSKNVPARGREWTPVPHSSFPRNEGVQYRQSRWRC